jgi:hypothetical protein
VKKKKPKKLTKKQILAKARTAKRKSLSEWSKSVRARDRWCIICRRTDHLNAHHILPKETYKDFMFEMLNGVTLCPTHHKFGKYSAHKNPVWFSLFIGQFCREQYAWAVKNVGTDSI